MMKKLASTLLLSILLFILPHPTLAKPRTIHIEWEYQFDGNVTGYRLYLNGNTVVCETNNALSTSMDCQVNLPDGEKIFSLTALFSDGSESPPSPVYAYIFSSRLKAAISAAPLSGTTPLQVAFDASASTGTIIAYDWVFGDGATGVGKTVSHIYSSAGNYTATLKVTDSIGATARKTVSITTTTPSIINIPPVAAISSSLSVGTVPLDVAFDGSGSYDSDGTILTYNWALGDGSSALGQLVTHSYLTTGTFYSTLMVTDDGGLTDAKSTPVIVSEPPGGENILPVPIITASSSQGTAPFPVSFSALSSHDPDGDITQYEWNFGDGTTGSGSVVDHIYIEPGTFSVILRVTDNMGAGASTTYSITARSLIPEPPFTIELGTALVSSSWTRIKLTKQFVNPIVLASPVSFNDQDPAVVRINNVDPSGFDIRVQEWDYLDGNHAQETIHYMAFEQGSYILDNGVKLEAGSFQATSRFQSHPFNSDFQAIPVVITSVMTSYENDAVTGRIKKLAANSFDYKLSEQEVSRTDHAPETIGYLAWTPKAGSVGWLQYEINRTENTVTDLWHQINFQNEYSGNPFFFATIQSYNSGENAALRYQYLTPASVYVAIEEEESKDIETVHTAESVGYMVFSLKN